MKHLRNLATLITSLCFSLQAFAQNTPKSYREKPLPPLANIAYHSKDVRDFVEKAKLAFTEEEYKFLLAKAEALPPHRMPKAREIKPGVFEFSMQGTKSVIKTLNTDKEIYEVNGTKLELAGKSLDERLKLLTAAVGQKKNASHTTNPFFPEAYADGGITLTLAVIGTILGVVNLCANLYDKNSANCAAVAKSAVDCLELTGKLQTKVKETATFFLTQKKIEETGDEKSPEIAKQTQEACKALNERVGELQVTVYKGKSSLQGFAFACSYDKETLLECQDGLTKRSGELKDFATKYCSPEATTTSPAVKKANTETATAPDIPIIPDVLKKETTGGATR